MARAKKTAVATVESHARMAKAIKMREAGTDFIDIGKVLGVSPEAARAIVAKAIQTFAPCENAEALRDLEASRLNKAQSAIWDQVLAGDLLAVKTFLAISDRRSKLLGLDAPAKLAVNVQIGVEEAEAARERIRRILADEQGRSLLMDITSKFVDGDTIDVEAIELGQREPTDPPGTNPNAPGPDHPGTDGDGEGLGQQALDSGDSGGCEAEGTAPSGPTGRNAAGTSSSDGGGES